MIASDTSALDALLADALIFTNHLGQPLTKQDDLAAHESGLLNIEELVCSEQRVRLHEDVAIVSVRTQLTGSYNGQPANGDFRFTRVWALSPGGNWHVLAAHSCLVG